MPAKRVFGPAPSVACLRQLGLEIPPDAFSSGSSLFESADQSYTSWSTWRDEAAARLLIFAQEQAVPSDWCPWSTTLAGDIYHAGLRVWLSQVFGAPVLIRTPADLRMWCLIQQRAVEGAAEIYPAACYWRGKSYPSPHIIHDRELLQWGASWPSGPKEGKWGIGLPPWGEFGRLSRSAPDDPDYWQLSGHFEEYLGEDFPKFYPRQDLPRLLQSASGYMQALGVSLGSAYPQALGEANDSDAWRNAMGVIVHWCLEQENRQADSLSSSPSKSAGNTDAKGNGKRVGEEKGDGHRRTMSDIEAAIWKYRADNISRYNELREDVKKGVPGAATDAQTMFGRNAMAKALNLPQGSVSKSKVRQEIARELGLLREGKEEKPLNRRPRTGIRFAEDERAEELGDTTLKDVIRRETIDLIQENKDLMKPGFDDELLSDLVAGRIDDDEARETLRLAIEQYADDSK